MYNTNHKVVGVVTDAIALRDLVVVILNRRTLRRNFVVTIR